MKENDIKTQYKKCPICRSNITLGRCKCCGYDELLLDNDLNEIVL